MTLQFATCDRLRALGFVASVYPEGKITDSPDSAGPLLDLVQSDVVRILDPAMHGKASIVPGTNWSESRRQQVIAACEFLKSL